MRPNNNEVNPANIEIEENIDNNNNDNENDYKKENVKNTAFINMSDLPLSIDLKQLTTIFNSYATKKTIATGFFNLALLATNFAQMKAILLPPAEKGPQTWAPLTIVTLVFICLSLLLQFLLAFILVFLAKNGEFINEEKRNQLIRSNNVATLFCFFITVLNICIDIFVCI